MCYHQSALPDSDLSFEDLSGISIGRVIVEALLQQVSRNSEEIGTLSVRQIWASIKGGRVRDSEGCRILVAQLGQVIVNVQ